MAVSLNCRSCKTPVPEGAGSCPACGLAAPVPNPIEPVDISGSDTAPAQAHDADALRAAMADRYVIERAIGAGGMATVYLANDLRHHRKVAIKVLRRDLTATLAAARFLREIQIAANLTHPHIVPLYDSGRVDDIVYYVMPFIDGESLRDRLDRTEHLTLDETLRMAKQVADALDCAHRQNIVHRDIKPANILLTNGHAVVADFGIARAISAAGNEEITGSEVRVGTPAYMSPEQFAGSAQVGPRSDVYSLACVVYESLLGARPPLWFDRESAGEDVDDLVPDEHRQRFDALPDSIRTTLKRALATHPAERFPEASEFSAALVPRDSLERIAIEIASTLDLGRILSTITEGLIDELDAAFARIWLLGPGDLCGECHKAKWCFNRERCLHLAASRGLSTNLNGEFRRVPLGALKIGRIAQGSGPLSTNEAVTDPRLPNKQWIEQNGLRSFAGYPLVFQGELLGVLAIFARRPLAEDETNRLEVFATQASVAIKNAQLYDEVQQLKERLQAENAYLQREIAGTHQFDDIVGTSPQIRRVLGELEQVAPTDSTVLVLGETGSGKELVARAIHNLSPRKDRPLVKVNCGAISAGLVESELFGHERGAFTGAVKRRIGRFELADGGTIFLDEVGDLPAETQVKLLRVLQEQEFERVGDNRPIKVDVRVIAATNRDLQQDVEAGSFRADLYYRLNVFPVRVPPLRERPADIEVLARFFLADFAKRLGKELHDFAPAAMQRLTRYSWPGNVRELQNVVERAAIVTRGPLVDVSSNLDDRLSVPHTAIGRTLVDVERSHVLETLSHTGWVIDGANGAAAMLDIHPNTLRSRMQKMGIKRPR